MSEEGRYFLEDGFPPEEREEIYGKLIRRERRILWLKFFLAVITSLGLIAAGTALLLKSVLQRSTDRPIQPAGAKSETPYLVNQEYTQKFFV